MLSGIARKLQETQQRGEEEQIRLVQLQEGGMTRADRKRVVLARVCASVDDCIQSCEHALVGENPLKAAGRASPLIEASALRLSLTSDLTRKYCLRLPLLALRAHACVMRVRHKAAHEEQRVTYRSLLRWGMRALNHAMLRAAKSRVNSLALMEECFRACLTCAMRWWYAVSQFKCKLYTVSSSVRATRRGLAGCAALSLWKVAAVCAGFHKCVAESRRIFGLCTACRLFVVWWRCTMEIQRTRSRLLCFGSPRAKGTLGERETNLDEDVLRITAKFEVCRVASLSALSARIREAEKGVASVAKRCASVCSALGSFCGEPLHVILHGSDDESSLSAFCRGGQVRASSLGRPEEFAGLGADRLSLVSTPKGPGAVSTLVSLRELSDRCCNIRTDMPSSRAAPVLPQSAASQTRRDQVAPSTLKRPAQGDATSRKDTLTLRTSPSRRVATRRSRRDVLHAMERADVQNLATHTYSRRLLRTCVLAWAVERFQAATIRVFAARRGKFVAGNWFCALAGLTNAVLELRARAMKGSLKILGLQVVQAWRCACLAEVHKGGLQGRRAIVLWCEGIQQQEAQTRLQGDTIRRKLLVRYAWRAWVAIHSSKGSLHRLERRCDDLHR